MVCSMKFPKPENLPWCLQLCVKEELEVHCASSSPGKQTVTSWCLQLCVKEELEVHCASSSPGKQTVTS
ncbi:hypothetical protein HGM15179_018839, partial [Zosterops borbonicus]